MKGLKKFDVSMSKIYKCLGVNICYTLCICDVRYTSPSFVINVVILEKSISKTSKFTIISKILSTLLQMRWKKLL
jgi:hypothetical protein